MTQQTLPADEGTGPVVEPDALAAEAGAKGDTAIAVAPQWKLVWWGFKRHKLAMAGLVVTVVIYLLAIFAEFLAPYSSGHYNPDYAYAPPQRLHFVDDGKWGMYVYGYKSKQDPTTLALTWTTDETKKVPVSLFAKGESYKLFGLIPGDRHLIGPSNGVKGPPMYLIGADRNGHDLLSRIIHGSRVSMSIGLVGVAFAFVLGVVLGGVSGFFGGIVDTLIQRAVEFFMSVPTLPLWLGLAAAVPPGWGPLKRYFAVTVILSMIAWTHLARVVRSRFLSLREEDFVTAATIDGASQPRIIFRHMLPSFSSYLIASLTLSIPGMILAETSLSFLGLGLQAPVVSWGVLLQEAQNIRAVATAPWLLLPGATVVVAVLSLNFLGDGLRDAADPYKH
ncbi:peptide/nickel transport system permease protein [Actinopolymorpha cephalotaxi]|uniref:Peptide/nickel transport system permease protein n=1 Tax=Actinopolymorpha cephalotaxi TaxID=504797 RepID=A0A1I2TR29_9ACTN|nr:ABC transporter permease [Actinopolymorpha cephalotaxi]NYH83185.1 peptide/nickel transport system permease protein [Actinopolymorpha cephalotaxi]SFG67223.1 peptide/nickel transport system permease protein [Actinopolymorpha cephalotaxi]